MNYFQLWCRLLKSKYIPRALYIFHTCVLIYRLVSYNIQFYLPASYKCSKVTKLFFFCKFAFGFSTIVTEISVYHSHEFNVDRFDVPARPRDDSIGDYGRCGTSFRKLNWK